MLTIADIKGHHKVLSSPAKTADTARGLLDLLAARAGLMVARHTSWLVVVDLRSIATFAADVHVSLTIEVDRAREWRCHAQRHSP